MEVQGEVADFYLKVKTSEYTYKVNWKSYPQILYSATDS